MSISYQDLYQEKLPLSLDVQGETIVCTKVLRHLVGKRLVMLGTYRNKAIVVKCFYHPKKFLGHSESETNGYNLLLKTSILTPKRLFVSHFQEYALVGYEYIQDSCSLQEAISEDVSKTRKIVLLNGALECLVKLHQAGLKQNDLHTNNFLLAQEKIYLVDAGAISSSERMKEIDAGLDNVALLTALFLMRDKKTLEGIYLAYMKQQKQPVHSDSFQYFIKRNKYWLNIEKKNFLSKAFRACTRLYYKKNFFERLICVREAYTEPMAEFLANPEALLEKAEILKAGNTCTVFRLVLAGKEYAVKRYNMKNIFYRFTRLFRPSRASISWYNAHLLMLAGIPIPKPIAIREELFGPFRGKAYYISEYLSGETADLFFKRPVVNEFIFEETQRATIALLNRLGQAQIFHGDLKANNILIKQNKAYLLDLDAMRQIENKAKYLHYRRKDIQRFLRNWNCDLFQESQFVI